MIRQFLSEGWKLRRSDQTEWIPAQVPGSVFSDLIRAGKLPDPYYRENEKIVRDASFYDYEYCIKFEVRRDLFTEEKVELWLEGIDTLGEVTLNGVFLGKTINMHHAYRFNVKEILQEGENYLSLSLKSPSRYVEEMHTRLPMRSPHGSMAGSAYIRKAHFMFGWDWGPQLPDLGIWKPVSLQAYSHPLLTDVVFRQDHKKSFVRLKILVAVEGMSAEEDEVEIELKEPTGGLKTLHNRILGKGANFQFDFSNPALWFPNGFGKQPLYSVVVRIRRQQRIVEEKAYRIGLRTIFLDRTPDKNGSSFRFRVNGIPIFAKGANFIPMDNLLSRPNRDSARSLILQCVRAHFNMIRVWGGGTYPDEALLDACDELGILVWQDLMFACMLYDLSPEFLDSIRLEIAEQVRRIRHRTCLALWCGNNEIEWMLEQGRFDPFLTPKLKGDYYRLFECTLPDLVKSMDPVTPFWSSSPSSGYDSKDPNDERYGDMHYWEVWHAFKPFDAYRTVVPRFMSEFGIQSFPSFPTIETFTEFQDRNIFSPVMENHQKHKQANGRILHYIGETFRFPKDFHSLVYLSQIAQAEGMRYGVEHWRRHRDICGGTLYWQLNDCWPGASWSSIDYSGRWKALHYYARRFFAPILLSLEDKGFYVSFHVTNDTLELFEGTCRWRLCLNTGECLEEDAFPVTILPCTSRKFAELNLSNKIVGTLAADWERRVFLRYSLEDNSQGVLRDDSILFVKPKHFEWLPVHVQLKPIKDGCGLILKSNGYAKFVEIQPPKPGLILEDNFFDLYPNEEKTIRFLEIGPDTHFENFTVFTIVDSFV